jgi:hypothetical protein
MGDLELLDSPEQKVKVYKGSNVFIVLSIILMMFNLFAVFISFQDIYSILWTGPVLGCLGLVQFIIGIWKKANIGIVTGVAPIVMVVGIFLTILLFKLGPAYVTEPLPLLGILFLLYYIPHSIFYLFKEFKHL